MKILLAEDDLSIRTIAKLTLQKVGGHDVTGVEDGDQALEKARTEKFDLIILDGMMPRLDGFETCKQLKADEQTKDIPVIFMTAKVQKQEVEAYLRMGALGVITKPFNPLTIAQDISFMVE